MAQQTAVEWLIEQISEKQPNGFYVIDTLEDVKRVFEQAKQKEMEQHGKTWLDSTTQFANDARMDSPIIFDDYYTKTYKK